MKKTTIAILVVCLLGVAAYFYYSNFAQTPKSVTDTTAVTDTTTGDQNSDQQANIPSQDKNKTVIGKTVQGNNIFAYHYGTGTTSLLFVGGIHGGYEWNTVLVAYQLMDYLQQNPTTIPSNVKVTVIPVLNPDGLAKVVGTTGRFSAADVSSSTLQVVSGRFNANGIDLNRNFDCDWQSSGTWQDKTVSGGSSAFSEPESQAFKSYIENSRPAGVVVWYSAVGGVFSSNCHDGVLAETKTLTKLFADASGYPAHEDFNFYEITGDAVNWLAKQKIPAISILLTNHTDTEWNKNIDGIKAIFAHYAK